MKLIKTILIICMMMTIFAGCSIVESNMHQQFEEKELEQDISDNELINIAMDIAKEENNYTYWLFLQDGGVDNNEIIQKEIVFKHNGEEFPEVYNYALVTDFNSMDDFVNQASKYLTAQYIENYLYKLIGMHPTESLPVPILLETDGNLYKITSINGVSSIPNLKYKYGEVVEKNDCSAIVRLYVDPSIDTDTNFVDYPLLLEDNIWKHNPAY